MTSITNISGNKPAGVLAMSCVLLASEVGAAVLVGTNEQGPSREEQPD